MVAGPDVAAEQTVETLQRELAVALAERDSAQAREAALAEVLKAINASAGDMNPVFALITDKAMTMCDADGADLLAIKDGIATALALSNPTPAQVEFWSKPFDLRQGATQLQSRPRTWHIADLADTELYRQRLPLPVMGVEGGGMRTLVHVPLLGERGLIGQFALFRRTVRPFSARQIALVEAFAAQAALAIENARLFTELRESLEQQTATAEILRAISQSPTDVGPVLTTVVKAALRFCGAEDVFIGLRDGDHWVNAAHAGTRGGEAGDRFPLTRQFALGQAVLDGRTAHVPDVAVLDPVEFATVHRLSQQQGFRAVLAAPLLREGAALGAVVLRRTEPGPFTPRQIELLEAFAAQAVIAIENVRLFTELSESLEQQTASAGVLRVISQSPTSVQPVFDAIAESALRLLNGWGVIVWRYENGHLQFGAARGGPPGSTEALPGMLKALSVDDIFVGEALRSGIVKQIVDVEAEPVDPALRDLARMRGWRSNLAVPMFRESQPVGVFTLSRVEPGIFSEREVRLMQTFAAQAVIAIENVRLFTELRESLEQQTATAEILRAISQSPTDIAPVMTAVAKAAVRFCGAEDAHVFLRDGEEIVSSAHEGPLSAHPLGHRDPLDIRLSRAQAIIEARVTEIVDTQALDDEQYPATRAYAVQHGFRAQLNAPLLQGDRAIGCICLRRREPGAFTARQIELLQTFAAQAVIAIENVRLFTELRESLEQQTATTEVLRVISQSPTEVQPVLEAVAKAAQRFCGAADVSIALRDGDEMHYATHVGPFPATVERTALDPSRSSGRAILEGRTIHLHDIQSLDPVEFAGARRLSAQVGFQSSVAAPMMREGSAVGCVLLRKPEPAPFTPRQIELLETFAAQAVIAIENVRLFTELRESLEYQTATSEVLDAIGRSTSDIQPVLDTMLKAALRLCRTESGGIAIQQGDAFRYVATMGWDPPMDSAIRARRIVPARGMIGDRTLLERKIVEIADVETDPDFPLPEIARGYHTALGVPLMRESEPIGVITLTRRKVEPFTERQIGLIRTFADQAVIAIENARLLGELTRREEELRVTFDHMGDGVVMFDVGLRLASWNRNFQELLDIPDSFLAGRPGLEDYVRLLAERGELGEDGAESQIARYRERANEPWSAERTRPDGRVIEVRNNPVPGGGAVLIYSDITARKKAEAEIAAARDAAEAALDKLKAAQANLIQSEKMASLGQLTAGIAHEIKNPLNFVNNFASLSVELLDELKEVAGPALATLDRERRAELDETMSLLTSNLGKIAEHGKRADGIVKSMLSHSRGGSGDWQPSDINALVDETLNLAYHGARAQDKEFNVTLERDFEKTAKPIEVVPQDVTRVFLNLFGNAFYAANRRRVGGREAGFRALIKVSTRDLGEMVEVTVRDNGIGIAPEMRDKLFQPFFTTKPTGEGTGLGLSISYDIVTQQHGGTIEVDSEPGQYTEFTVRLPRRRRPSKAEKT